jgi:hypothetical protein
MTTVLYLGSDNSFLPWPDFLFCPLDGVGFILPVTRVFFRIDRRIAKGRRFALLALWAFELCGGYGC